MIVGRRKFGVRINGEERQKKKKEGRKRRQKGFMHIEKKEAAVWLEMVGDLNSESVMGFLLLILTGS